MNLDLVGWNPLQADALHMAGSHAMEVRAGYLFVAAFGDTYSNRGGLYVLDVTTNPDKPAIVGHLPGLGPMGGDRSIDATQDGDFVVLGTEALPAAYTKTGIVNPTPSGVLLIDTRDKANPRVVDYQATAGVHSVIVTRVNGEDYVYTCDATDRPWSVYRIRRDLPVPVLERAGRLAIWHDASAFHDPIDNKTYLVAADGRSGLHDNVTVWDLSANPAAPTRVGFWRMPDSGIHYAHSALMTYVEGKRVIIATSENGGADPTPVWFLDATDFGNMTVIGKWTPPVGGGSGLIFSLHNPRVVDGLLYFAHYHAGVVVFDVSRLANLQALPLVGYHVPSKDLGYRSPLDPVQLAAGIDAIHYPRVYDVAVHPETKNFYAADIWTGVYAYAPIPR